MDWWSIGIAVGGGFIAGIINTLAGSGSAITLTILTEVLGLPGGIANGSNRIGIALQTLSSSYTFHRARIINWTNEGPSIFITSMGAFLGIGLALWVDHDQFMFVFRFLIVALFFLLLIRPKKWIHPNQMGRPWPKPVLYSGLFVLGIYGGFIQMGMGLFFLALAVLGAKMSLLKANAMKVLIVGIYTIPAIILFASQGQIHWIYGLPIGLGQLVGGWLTARFAVRFPKINELAYFFLLLAILLAIGSLFNLY